MPFPVNDVDMIFDRTSLTQDGKRGSTNLAPQVLNDLSLQPKSTGRRWSVNARFLTRNATGVDRYAMEILTAMDALISAGHPLTSGLAIEILCPAGALKNSPFAQYPAAFVAERAGPFVGTVGLAPLRARGTSQSVQHRSARR